MEKREGVQARGEEMCCEVWVEVKQTRGDFRRCWEGIKAKTGDSHYSQTSTNKHTPCWQVSQLVNAFVVSKSLPFLVWGIFAHPSWVSLSQLKDVCSLACTSLWSCETCLKGNYLVLTIQGSLPKCMSWPFFPCYFDSVNVMDKDLDLWKCQTFKAHDIIF